MGISGTAVQRIAQARQPPVVIHKIQGKRLGYVQRVKRAQVMQVSPSEQVGVPKLVVVGGVELVESAVARAGVLAAGRVFVCPRRPRRAPGFLLPDAYLYSASRSSGKCKGTRRERPLNQA